MEISSENSGRCEAHPYPLLEAVLPYTSGLQSPDPSARRVALHATCSANRPNWNADDFLGCLTFLSVIAAQDPSYDVRLDAISAIRILLSDSRTPKSKNLVQQLHFIFIIKTSLLTQVLSQSPNTAFRCALHSLIASLGEHSFMNPEVSLNLICSNLVYESDTEVKLSIYQSLFKLLSARIFSIPTSSLINVMQKKPTTLATSSGHDCCGAIYNGTEDHLSSVRESALRTTSTILITLQSHSSSNNPFSFESGRYSDVIRIAERILIEMLVDHSPQVFDVALESISQIQQNSTKKSAHTLDSFTSRTLLTRYLASITPTNPTRLQRIQLVFKKYSLSTIRAFIYLIETLERSIYKSRSIFNRVNETHLVDLYNAIIDHNIAFAETVNIVRTSDTKLLPIVPSSIQTLRNPSVLQNR